MTTYYTVQKMKFYIREFISKSDQILSFPCICSHLLKKFLMENFIFCVVIWKYVMKEEIKSLEKNNMHCVIKLPEGKNLMGEMGLHN